MTEFLYSVEQFSTRTVKGIREKQTNRVMLLKCHCIYTLQEPISPHGLIYIKRVRRTLKKILIKHTGSQVNLNIIRTPFINNSKYMHSYLSPTHYPPSGYLRLPLLVEAGRLVIGRLQKKRPKDVATKI